MTKKEEVLEIFREGAKKNEAAGQMTLAAFDFSMAIMTLLSIAVTTQPSKEEVLKCLEAQDIRGLLARYLTVVSANVERDDGVPVDSKVGSSYELSTFSHIGLLLGELEMTKRLVTLANLPEVKGATLPFWKKYSESLASFLKCEAIELPTLKLKGQQKYLWSYLRLMAALASQSGLDNALQEVEAQFQARQKDRSIKDDNWEIEGTGFAPSLFDFRKESLLEFHRNSFHGI